MAMTVGCARICLAAVNDAGTLRNDISTRCIIGSSAAQGFAVIPHGLPPCAGLQSRRFPPNFLATPKPIKDWSLISVKGKLIKIGGKVIRHGRAVAFKKR